MRKSTLSLVLLNDSGFQCRIAPSQRPSFWTLARLHDSVLASHGCVLLLPSQCGTEAALREALGNCSVLKNTNVQYLYHWMFETFPSFLVVDIMCTDGRRSHRRQDAGCECIKVAKLKTAFFWFVPFDTGQRLFVIFESGFIFVQLWLQNTHGGTHTLSEAAAC